MTNNEELERERFEAWYCQNYNKAISHLERHDNSGNYFCRQTRAAWRAWLARSKQEDA